MRKLSSGYEKSETLRSRLTWFDCDEASSGIKQYFDEELCDVSGSSVHTVSLIRLLDSFKLVTENMKEKRKESEENVTVLSKELEVKETKIQEVVVDIAEVYDKCHCFNYLFRFSRSMTSGERNARN